MIWNGIRTIKDIINFFRQSLLWDKLLKKISDQTNTSHSTFISLCDRPKSMWLSKDFEEMLPLVRATLEALQEAASSDIAIQTYLHTTLENSQLVLSIVILRKKNSYTANLNKAMQKVNLDLTNTCSYAKTNKNNFTKHSEGSQFLCLFDY